MMESMLEDSRVPIRYISCFREYRLMKMEHSERIPGYLVLSSPNHYGLSLIYCPWCGKQLPPSLYEEWKKSFLLLPENKNDHSLLFLSKYPEEFKTDEWWVKKGL